MNSPKWLLLSFKKRVTLKRIFLFVIVVLLYGECVCFFIDRYFWIDLPCEPAPNNPCTRILFVADPQIIGVNDGDSYTNFIRIWDSDRYLYYSYQHAVSHLKPNVIVFLGDLMDEGSTSTIKEYLKYLKRFHEIFDVSYDVQYIYIPGDNDIGGEFGDWITPEKIFRFEHILSGNQSKRIEYNEYLTFYKINRLVQDYHHGGMDDEEIPSQIRIILSHMPLTNIGFVDSSIKRIKPNVIFSAHNHVPYSIVYDTISEEREFKKIDFSNEIYIAHLKTPKIFEYVVPTCSYRMGVPNMGYGAAVLDNEHGDLKYTIYWIHSRFLILHLYLISLFSIFIMILLLTIIKYLRAMCRRYGKTKNGKNITDYVPVSQNVC
ncbi:metallophosphoesterase 1 [Chrysoperla carnea]|uniref:metallophosphoesterase 1 n=1 Tax=Chrysoperla carnea TaxID=189513 RepID=UPI001D0667BB|nr:metallophosphoesterase 1 [Chrysoperla carnea]